MDELQTICSWYLEKVLTIHNRSCRSVDDSRGVVHIVELDDTTLR
jgi:hypothetical protein